MRKNILATVVICAAILLSSCGGDKSSGSITLEWWQFWTDPAIKPTIEKIVSDFETANPNIKVNITDLTWANGREKIVLAFSSETAPDIVELGSDWVPQFISADQLYPMGKKIAADTSKYFGWTPGMYEKEIYAFPWILGTRVLYLNRDLLLQAGYDQGFVPFHWDQLKECCYKIDSIGKDIHGFGSNAAEKHRLYKKFLPLFWAGGAHILSKDGSFSTIASDKAYAALKLYKELSDSVGLVDTQRRLEDAFLDGSVGVIISGDWLLKRICKEGLDIDFVTTVIPGPKYPGRSFVGGEYLAISKQSKNKDAALKFIRHLTSRDNQMLFCTENYSANPSNKEAAADSFFITDPHLHIFYNQLNLSSMPRIDKHWPEIEEIIESMLEDVLFNNAPMAEALYQAKHDIEKLYAGQ